MDDELWNDNEDDLNDFDNIIHIHVHKIKNKNVTVIDGLKFTDLNESKQFITLIKKKFGIAGYESEIKKINENDKVFVFSGDNRNKISNILIDQYNKNEENIEIH